MKAALKTRPASGLSCRAIVVDVMMPSCVQNGAVKMTCDYDVLYFAPCRWRAAQAKQIARTFKDAISNIPDSNQYFSTNRGAFLPQAGEDFDRDLARNCGRGCKIACKCCLYVKDRRSKSSRSVKRL